MSTGTNVLTQLRDELRTHRESREATKALARDLASFSNSDLLDLDAIIDRHDPKTTVEIRRVLNRQRAA